MCIQCDEIESGPWYQRKFAIPLPPVETYEHGVHLTSQGEVASCAYYVVKGVVKLVHMSPDGRESIVDLAFAGDLVGAQSVLLREKCFETATTVVTSGLARWRAPEFLARFEGEPAFSREVSRVLCWQVYRLRCRLSELGFQTARQKFEALLRSWPYMDGSRREDPTGEFDFPFTRTEIAQFLSITPYYLTSARF